MRDQFGHHGIHIEGAFLDSWGSGPLLMRYFGNEWWFEFSEMFGPQLLRKSDMQPANRQPISEKHPFWEPFELWHGAGKKCRPIRYRGKDSHRIRFWLCHVPPLSTIMTPRQRELARHALGLPNKERKSYRNRFVTPFLSNPTTNEWVSMLEDGLAKCGKPRNGQFRFWLTLKGARAALDTGETLDAEDFPAAAETAEEAE